MAKKQKIFKPKARLVRGFRDMAGGELRLMEQMTSTLARVYEAYGFDGLDTPSFEYADALGKFLPDDDRPNDGVFALEDDDGQWLSLRYDLTAPLARYVAQNYDQLPKPLRRYQKGIVYRNEKPGPGRFRQFMQFDADIVGAANQAADSEICMLAADAMHALGLRVGQYIIRVNNRKILDAVLEIIGLAPDSADYESRRLTILRAMDKLDRLGIEGVEALLGEGRKDESGDFTKGAGLTPEQIAQISAFLNCKQDTSAATLTAIEALVVGQEIGQSGVQELRDMADLFAALGYDETQIMFDPSVVRGLDYYTGPVFEIELLSATEDDGLNRFGAVGGGGRYNDLIKRFKGVEVPATGISIGISRLAAALTHLGVVQTAPAPLVVALIMERDYIADTARLVQELRRAGIRAEFYSGDSSMKAQLRYADARHARLALIEGEDERAQGMITIKDLALGREKSSEITDNATWRASEHAQINVPRADISQKIKEILEI